MNQNEYTNQLLAQQATEQQRGIAADYYNGNQRPAVNPPPPEKPRTAFNMVGEMGPLFAALAKAQGAFGPITKAEDVDVIKEGRKLYSFVYAPLDVVLAATRKGLSENGLSLFHGLAGMRDRMSLRTILAHSSGAYIECVAELQPKADKNNEVTVQAMGSEVTYVRRYTVLCLLGVFPADEDDDGGAAEGLQVQRNGPRANTRPTPPPVQPPLANRQANTQGKPKAEPKPEPKPAPEPEPPPDDTVVISDDGEVIELAPKVPPTTPPPAPERAVELDPAEREKRRKAAILAVSKLWVAAGFSSRAQCQDFMNEHTGKKDSSAMTLEEVEKVKAALEARVA